MLAMSTPQEGNHHDLFQIQNLFGEICSLLQEGGISLRGLFLNADAGFDSAEFVSACESREIIANLRENPRNSTGLDQEPYQSGTHVFDAELYAHRSGVEHANAWLDGFKALLIRFEFSQGRLSGQKLGEFTLYRIYAHFPTQNQSKKESLNRFVVKKNCKK